MLSQSDPARSVPAPSRPRLSLIVPEDAGLGPDTLAFPSEAALLLRVALPLPTHRQRLAAVGFAVEDQIAQPLDAVHVALGPQIEAGDYLAAVVDHGIMAEWATRTRAGHQRLVPDVLALPVPPEGRLAVRETAGRILARRPDGTGYATTARAIDMLWRIEGMPQIVLYGGRLPDGLPVSAVGLMPSEPAGADGFDLLQGIYAPRQGAGAGVIRRLAIVAALALAAHAAILVAETVALSRIATDRETELRTAIAARAPDIPASLPLVEALARAMPASGSAGGGFLPLMVEVSEVLAPFTGEISVRNLAYGAQDQSLALLIEAPDLAALQAIESALGVAGLAVAAGVATTGEGAAEARYVIRRSGS